MSLKKNNNMFLKYLDFILIDLISFICSFFVAYYLKFDNIYAFEKQEWAYLFVMLCCINLIAMFCVNPYRGIYKRRYYLQFYKECSLFISQIASICLIFYALKIGTIFSREMMFTMYSFYFISSQTIKYFYKKFRNNEFSIFEKKIEKNKNVIWRELTCIKGKKKINTIITLFFKRLIDISVGIIGCIFLIPITLIVFILNRINGEDGPVFYVQERIGKYGKKFKMFKFRSMCVDADEKLEIFLEENEEIKKEFYIYRKIKNDPRITKVGRVLRKTSLDEFPQFINLLIGNMSLVGPRPYLEREKEDMGKYYDIIIRDKPGITGLWQISGRSETTFEERLKMDLEYNSTKSLLKDFYIILKTISKVLQKKGAI